MPFEPAVVRTLACERVLDLVIRDDPPLFGINEQHAARADALFEHDVLGRDVQRSDLGGHDHEIVFRDVVARRPQPVSIEHRTDNGAVGKGHGGGTVPRLHQRGVILVECAACGAHARVVLPRLGNHHEHRVRQRSSRHDQEFQHVVEGCRIATAFADDREDPLEVCGVERIGGQEGFASPHPVDVAAERVDLPIVRDESVGMRERPGRKGVRAEPLVYERERGLHADVGQIGKHRPDLRCGQHPLVDERPAGQAGHVEAARRGRHERVDGVLDPLANHVQLPLEPDVIGPRIAGLR